MESAFRGRFVTRRTLRTLFSCVANGSKAQNRIFSPPSQPHRLIKHTFYTPNITFESFQNCSLVKNAAITNVRLVHPIRKKSDKSVAFQMINDNLTDSQIQVSAELRADSKLDSVRRRKSKFVCINDDLSTASEAAERMIHEFYESFFPLPSQFEKNRSGFLGEQ